MSARRHGPCGTNINAYSCKDSHLHSPNKYLSNFELFLILLGTQIIQPVWFAKFRERMRLHQLRSQLIRKLGIFWESGTITEVRLRSRMAYGRTVPNNSSAIFSYITSNFRDGGGMRIGNYFFNLRKSLAHYWIGFYAFSVFIYVLYVQYIFSVVDLPV